MDSNDFASIFKNSLNDVIVQIDIFCTTPETYPGTVIIRLDESDYSNPREFKLKTCLALTNYFIGMFEGISRTRLSNVLNFTVTPENKEKYLTEFDPFFDKLRKYLKKLCADKIMDIYIKRDVNSL